MLPGYRAKASVGIGLWFLLKVAALGWAFVAGQDSPVNTSVFWALFVGGTACLLWGCWAQARGKGYSDLLALLGLAGLLGLIILAVLPDKVPGAAATDVRPR